MIKVLCTVVVILGDGYRDVRQLDGFVVREGVSGYNETLYVDFGEAMPSPQVRWVHENDCLYYEDPSKHYEEFERLNESEIAWRRREIIEHWDEVIRKLRKK